LKLYINQSILCVGFSSLGSSRTWICYWILHSLALLGRLDAAMDAEKKKAIVSFLGECQHESGGFGGGPGQMPHLATTYAAVCALVTLGGDDALSIIRRDALMDFFLRMSIPAEQGGGMTMHQGGEVDVRGCYCALCVCYMLNMDIQKVSEACSLASFVRKCQSHEGGIGGEPGNEAHGGYTFCAFGALVIAGEEDAVDVELLKSWLGRMQGVVEGGMRGRTNKLVDGCYSWWQGGLCNIASSCQSSSNSSNANVDYRNAESIVSDAVDNWLETKTVVREEVCREQLEEAQERFDTSVDQLVAAEDESQSSDDQKTELFAIRRTVMMLQDQVHVLEQQLASITTAKHCQDVIRREYADDANAVCDMLALQFWILQACQVKERGGLRDKPGKHVDFYHTCYCLSGLSIAQQYQSHHQKHHDCSGNTHDDKNTSDQKSRILGGERNTLCQTHPVCNVVQSKVDESMTYFLQ
jgi:protein farnesyltransferase subunit beta